MQLFSFILFSLSIGFGLAMDAFSVSLANGLNEPCMKRNRMCLIAGVFAFFQFLMPLLGWLCVHTIVQYFGSFEKFIPYIALILLSFIGGKMLYEGFHCDKDEDCCCGKALGFGALLIQGVATAIDALSTGFTIAEYDFWHALACCLLIAVVTFILCFIGLFLGKKFGTFLAGKASLLGGIVLIVIGVTIFLRGIL